MKPFEQMTEAERLEHLLGPHRLPDDKAMYEGLSEEEFIECHQMDHDEYLADDHRHGSSDAATTKFRQPRNTR